MPNHSTIAAYAALFIAIGGGTATAAGLARNSVGSSQIRDRSIAVRDLSRTARPPTRARIAQISADTMTSDQVLSALSGAVKGEKGDIGPAGPAGPAGPQGPEGTIRVNDISQTVTVPVSGAQFVVQCPTGQKVTGGGIVTNGATTIVSSGPTGDDAWLVRVGGDPQGERSGTVTAICS